MATTPYNNKDYSDSRLKTNFAAISTPLAKVQALQGLTYNGLIPAGSEIEIDTTTPQVGLIAQAVQGVLPQAVIRAEFDEQFNENGTSYSISGQNYLTVDYGRVVPLLVAAIKEIIGGDSTNLYFKAGSNIFFQVPNGTDRLSITSGGASVNGALSKSSGSFKITHPLPAKSATHDLVHSFIEGPTADLIYRGKTQLVNGMSLVNIDTAATMTEGTFNVLCGNVQCFTTNESGWNHVRGSVAGNILTIEAQDSTCTDHISWMVIGERKDPHMINTTWTDSNGRVIVEPLRVVEPTG